MVENGEQSIPEGTRVNISTYMRKPQEWEWQVWWETGGRVCGFIDAAPTMPVRRFREAVMDGALHQSGTTVTKVEVLCARRGKWVLEDDDVIGYSALVWLQLDD